MCLGIVGRVTALSTAHPDLAEVDVAGVVRPINVGLLSIGDRRRALIPCTPAGAMILIDRACERLGVTLPGMIACQSASKC